ncbi:Predicted nuclease of the RNAse H fold, HicB family [Oribacterium sp. KHPX15]|uniref:type II toxin-antitoxin system HicB family antitoxin n=1 Tax=unclassified Oribacterium TaxID=2629782 RepID=UPI0004E26BC0|nr:MULTISPECIES: type II toxin-antitoxin system HicB family antitoxin [unclassified Oribacterium]SDZ88611.1 Predicted nuclease of the RNAse H fold, HicB family [Oribacterium sp. KHPX15]
MTTVYPVILTKDKDDILIEVPDLEILTEAKSIQEAVVMARDAIGLTGISMQDNGDSIPEPSDIDDIDVSKGTFAEVGKGIKTLVDIDFDEYRRKNDNKMVRRNVTLPNWMNRRAEQEHLNVSRFLQDALAERYA